MQYFFEKIFKHKTLPNWIQKTWGCVCRILQLKHCNCVGISWNSIYIFYFFPLEYSDLMSILIIFSIMPTKYLNLLKFKKNWHQMEMYMEDTDLLIPMVILFIPNMLKINVAKCKIFIPTNRYTDTVKFVAAVQQKYIE